MSSLEAKIVVLGSQGVGKTSLVTRYCKGAFNPAQTTSTVGASFMTKRVVDTDTDTVVRLQIWDTAGQERFRSISRLYYRGANACILCYSITDAQSFAEMGMWLTELRRNLPPDIVLHVVGTKADIVARDPTRREVPFERCIAYVAENLAPGLGSTPPPSATPTGLTGLTGLFPPHTTAAAAAAASQSSSSMNTNAAAALATASGAMMTTTTPSSINAPQQIEPRSPSSKRSSGFWGQEVGWDACHEISAESGEGVEEVFRVVTRKLVEQNRKMQQAILAATATPGATPGHDYYYSSSSGMDAAAAAGYFDHMNSNYSSNNYNNNGNNNNNNNNIPGRGSFRIGRDRRSWFLSPGFSPSVSVENAGANAGGGGGDGTGNYEHGRGGQSEDLAKGGRRCC
ncbi:putative ras-like GTP-binding protein [Biscogniauxia marginata]|nr:putative ras-like GTP-binding protein [Biscogniauxia marginata]